MKTAIILEKSWSYLDDENNRFFPCVGGFMVEKKVEFYYISKKFKVIGVFNNEKTN